MFDPVVVNWRGQKHTIPADGVLRAIAAVEEVLTISELFDYYKKGSPSLAKLSMAFAALMRHLGVTCSDEEVYASMFDANQRDASQAAVTTLLALMVPKLDKPGADVTPSPQKAGRASSRRTIKR